MDHKEVVEKRNKCRYELSKITEEISSPLFDIESQDVQDLKVQYHNILELLHDNLTKQVNLNKKN
ncbi:hypothetical protein M1M30_gp133 [Maribacter phage Colly_1]|uniref:Uncharacterized protein n=1 Tax=Maribacter phage Colly_1 TaxID=2745691 RepID=A0A8E4XXT6_9CAUD|nr:hypothetical protein M1M30_gp133 [Maribacter phage Colly_1]QQO97233.1 hypothetical protein Colly1_133 [Maribacter phage Colly_1]